MQEFERPEPTDDIESSHRHLQEQEKTIDDDIWNSNMEDLFAPIDKDVDVLVDFNNAGEDNSVLRAWMINGPVIDSSMYSDEDIEEVVMCDDAIDEFFEDINVDLQYGVEETGIISMSLNLIAIIICIFCRNQCFRSYRYQHC